MPRDRHLRSSLSLRVHVLQHVLCQLDGERAVGERRERHDTGQRALEFADVRGDAARDERQHLGIRDRETLRLDALAQDGDARLEVGGLDVGEKAPLETGTEPFLERRDLARRPVGRDDDLGAAFVQRVERVEELLLDPLLALDELDVVDEQHVVVAVAALEPLDPCSALTHGVDELVHERLARHVARREAFRVLTDVVADRLQEVRLAEAGAAVDEERVVRLRRRLGDRERGRMCEAVRRADHEEVERVLRVELDLGQLALHELRPRFDTSAATGGSTTRSAEPAARWTGCAATANETEASFAPASAAARVTRSRKWPSIQSRVKSFGTSTTSRSAPNECGRA